MGGGGKCREKSQIEAKNCMNLDEFFKTLLEKFLEVQNNFPKIVNRGL